MATLEEILSHDGTRRRRVEQALAAARATDLLSHDDRQSLIKLTLDRAIADLRGRRDSLPDSYQQKAPGCFTPLDSVLMPLMQLFLLLQLQRGMDMDDVLGPYPSGNDAFDVLNSDVKPEHLPGRISEALQIPYLAAMEARPSPIKGIIFNTRDAKLRVLVSLPVSARGRSVAAHFILDTGALRTYIALSVLKALRLPEISMYSEVVKLNGVTAAMGVSDNEQVSYDGGRTTQPTSFAGLNILGMDFLDKADVSLEMDMPTRTVALASPQFPSSK
ncbi:hypothetical protein MMC07_005690 [Pseudocyphellaria aurata]|nr:hypothetical protein [Pseudocyphellaria aurata]